MIFDTNKHIYKPDNNLFVAVTGQFPEVTKGSTPPLHQVEVTNQIDRQVALYTNQEMRTEFESEVGKLRTDLNSRERSWTRNMTQHRKNHDARVAEIKQVLKTLTGHDSFETRLLERCRTKPRRERTVRENAIRTVLL